MYLPVIGRYFTVVVMDGKDKGTYQSSLLDIDSHHLFITTPESAEGRSIVLSQGTRLVLNYRDDKDIPCRFETVIEKAPDGNEGIHALKCPDVIERQQRREDVRIPVYGPVTLQAPGVTSKGILNDLSGGGFSAWFTSADHCALGQTFDVKFEVKSGRQSIHVDGRAQAVACHEPEGSDAETMCSFKFVDMSDSLRADVIEFVFERQLLDVALKNMAGDVAF